MVISQVVTFPATYSPPFRDDGLDFDEAVLLPSWKWLVRLGAPIAAILIFWCILCVRSHPYVDPTRMA